MSDPDDEQAKQAVALRLLTIGLPAVAGESAVWRVEPVASVADAVALRATDAEADLILLAGGDGAPSVSAVELDGLLARTAVVVVVGDRDLDGEAALAWLRRGVDDVLGQAERRSSAGRRRLRFVVERRRRAAARDPAHATDPGTGLPHRQQFIEHLSHLLALREREPSPMAVVALRIEGLTGAPGAADGAHAELLRRKIAVRLRAGVRGSDVVAAIVDDAFAVLLGSILTPADGERVAAKLVASLLAPFAVAGAERGVAVAVGIGHYPADGIDPERLLRRALALAAAAPAEGRAGATVGVDASGAPRQAANDDG